MRIVLLAVDDEFAGEMQRPLYEQHPEWIVGSVISSCAVYKHSSVGAAWMTLRASGVLFLLEMIRIKMLRRLIESETRVTPSRLAGAHGVAQFTSRNINDEAGVAKLCSWHPDLIISTNFSHYLGSTVRERIAKDGCWNLHKSLLPRYRGMAPSFHALLEGAPMVGATLHVVAKGFDTGDILDQAAIPVTPTDSVYSLNCRTSQAGGRLLATYLERFEPSTTRAVAQPPGDWKSYSYPTRSEVKAFRARGLRFYSSLTSPQPNGEGAISRLG
jgi:folate-dependent phosphoribosylglycinamide formyltransferase PurN